MFGVGVGIRVGGFTPSSGGVTPNLLLDDYPNAAAAYSVRKLRNAYAGSAIRVRRSSDNTEQDIGFTALGGLDTTTLTSFCSGTNGFVTTWYDQSGNGLNVTQTTATNQPLIVNSGSVITVTGIGGANPSILFDGTNDFLNRTFLNFTDYSVFSVHKKTTIGTQPVAYQNGTTGGFGLNTAQGTNYSMYEAGVADHLFGTTSTDLRLISGVRNQGSSILNAYVNATLFTLSPNPIITPTGNFNIGSFSSSLLFFYGNQSELIFYTTNQTSNFTGISTNINTYYAIY